MLRKIESALSAAENRPDQWGAPTWTQRLLPIRIDLSLSASTGSDFERVILTIRLALAGALGRTLPSFDVSLRHYWEHVHPRDPLDEYVRRTGLTGRFAEMLPQQLQAGAVPVACFQEVSAVRRFRWWATVCVLSLSRMFCMRAAGKGPLA
ncbi:hypothetical protein [Streptomyces virginiae]|uniref:hypothetical protein n=1 Tax=Streptomyces virginiae TaxID=1961 RepID=UPI0022593FC2|nr:hypothetical protein [Streptomyces virginiae]MCX5174443.1 hypothetical protein [Streptomyces virginiae]